MSEGATVHLVDDDPAVRESFVYLLGAVDLEVATYSNSDDFLGKYQPGGVACFLLDAQTPSDSLAVLNAVRDHGWSVPVILVTAHGTIATAVAAMRAGAFDFVEKPFDESDLVERVQQGIAAHRKIIEGHRERVELVKRVRMLSPREAEVLDLVVAGEPTKSIASELGTSFNTVQNQRASILRKMQARSVADLVRMVMIARGAQDAG